MTDKRVFAIVFGIVGGIVAAAATRDHATFPFAVGIVAAASADTGRPPEEPQKSEGTQKNELVMSPGMKITATTRTGTITIIAVDDLTRSYTWEGATRSVEMWPRAERWYGSLGLYYPGPGDHWEEHNGITRGVVEEGASALGWAKESGNKEMIELFRKAGAKE